MDVFQSRDAFHTVVDALINAIRKSPSSLIEAVDHLNQHPQNWADVLTDGVINDPATQNFPAYGPFAEASIASLTQALMLARVAEASETQMTRDYVAGEWVAFTLNAQVWSDLLLLIHALATGRVRSGWGSGFGSKMTAIWNMIEAEQNLTNARHRNYWLRTVAFGDALAMMDANNGHFPNDIPRNGALKAEISEQAARLAQCQKSFDTARKNLELALKDVTASSSKLPAQMSI